MVIQARNVNCIEYGNCLEVSNFGQDGGKGLAVNIPERTILAVDDDREMLEIIEATLARAGYELRTVTSGEMALEELRRQPRALVITDLVMPSGIDGLELLGKIRDEFPETGTILLTGHSSVETAVKALKMGAFDYLSKPFDPEELVASVERLFAYREVVAENLRLRHNLAERDGDTLFVIGSSAPMRRVMNMIRAVAPMPTSVLIRGESGTGKELVADEIHRISPRENGPLIKVNCAALPENLLEDELFGHEKGAFTGAVSRRIGRFEEADGGTIFLDEIAEMSPLLQAKLLRVLQERTFQRVGSNREIKTDVRIICATNKDLEAAVAEGRFREDLYYRINVVQLEVPPLRERRQDTPALVEALGKRISLRLGMPAKAFTAGALKRLQAMDFPGNVRELQNLIERVLIFTQGPEVRAEDIPEGQSCPVADEPPAAPAGEVAEASSPPLLSGLATLEEIEREAIRQMLHATGGNMYRAAKQLNISRSTLYSKVKKLGLERYGKA